MQFFRDLLGEQRIVTDLSDLENYNMDWMRHLRGNGQLVLKPKNTIEVSKILSFCNENLLAVCVQGGNTGIVGGSVPVLDEIIISTSLMDDIIDIDDTSGTLVCQAGCILENLETALADKGLQMPLDLGAKGSCHIGGNVATNAGGLRLIRYGNLHGNVLGLEVVKANGEILDCLNTLKKDNTGFHLKNLFIGSEGSLGFITKVAMQCPPKQQSTNVAFLGLQSFAKVLTTYQRARQHLGEILSAVELIDTQSMQFAKETLNIDSPIGEYPFYLLLETSGSREDHDTEKMNAFLDLALMKHWILNGTVANDSAKVKKIWSVRERIPESFLRGYYVFCYDFTLPLKNYYALVEDIREYMGDKAISVFGFGHLGDGNLHLQIAVREYKAELREYLEPYVFKKVKALNGSISAEHGIGFVKAHCLDLVKGKETLSLMRQLKLMMDPNKILNPYKTILFEKH